jgi:hypothetical protein
MPVSEDPQESINLYEGQLASSLATLYTCPAGYEVDVDAINIVNSSGSTVTGIRLDRVPSGGTDGAGDEIYVNNSLATLTTVTLPPGGESILVTLMPGDKITADCGTASAIDVTISGVIRQS